MESMIMHQGNATTASQNPYLLELGDFLGVAEALSHCFEPGGQLEDPHVDEEVVGEADLDSGFAERHRTSSPLL